MGTAFAWPFLGLSISLLLYLALRSWLGQPRERMLVRVFAAAAVSSYYWFRLPALFGFGMFSGDGMLVDLTSTLPAWFPIASQLTTTLLFAYLLVWRHREPQGTWTVRPPFSSAASCSHK